MRIIAGISLGTIALHWVGMNKQPKTVLLNKYKAFWFEVTTAFVFTSGKVLGIPINEAVHVFWSVLSLLQ